MLLYSQRRIHPSKLEVIILLLYILSQTNIQPRAQFSPLDDLDSKSTTLQSSSIADTSTSFSNRRLKKLNYTNTLFMLPTRELAIQVTEWIRLLAFGNVHSESSALVQCLVSGVSIEDQLALLKRKAPSIIVGTPKRLFEIFNEHIGAMDFSRLQLVIIDEIDRIIDPQTRYGHHNPKQREKHILTGQALIQKIVKERKLITTQQQLKLNDQLKKQQLRSTGASIDDNIIDAAKLKRLQVVASSATMNNPCRKLLISNGWMKDSVFINPNADSPHFTNKNISHHCYFIDEHKFWNRLKPDDINAPKDNLNEEIPKEVFPEAFPDDDDLVVEKVVTLMEERGIKKAFVFANASTSISKLVERLRSHGIKADKLFNIFDYTSKTTKHGEDFSETSEKENMGSELYSGIYSGEVDVVVCTEYESRGLNLPIISNVFVLGLPSSPGSYLHMAGRSSRFGNKGSCITLLAGERYLKRFRNTMRLLRLNVEV